MRKLVYWLLFFAVCAPAWSDTTKVHGIIISSIEQLEDDEEAPFEIRARNKAHRCGGKSSSLFRVYSEYEAVAMRRFFLALEAMKQGWSISVTTDGCEDKALLVNSIRLEH
ncbi:hypothetical protein A9Q73_07095 [Bermanella sp. 47_1433_sub80_T6]|nr:hypothetical protein A9Q73_07095 [Bermanella sp. 47_1433_sub80_T6]